MSGSRQGDSTPSAERLSIMCCGDSRTHGTAGGTTVRGAYRFTLNSLLTTRKGFAPRFIGGTSDTGITWNMCGQGARTTTTLLTDIQAQSPRFPSTQIFLIDIGANDVNTGVATATSTANVDSMITQIRIDSPNATIWVAKIFDIEAKSAQVVTYNDALTAKMALRSDYSATNVLAKTMMYDLYTLVGPYGPTNFSNALHCNDTGYDVVANGWYNQIITLF